MSRNRPRSPRTSDHILIRLTEAVDRIATALAEVTKRPAPVLVNPELMLCRHLSLKHVGMYVEVMPRPLEKWQHDEPGVLRTAGILVGITPAVRATGSREQPLNLVIAMGSAQQVIPVPAAHPVQVLPRSLR